MLAIKNNLMAETAARHLGRSYDSLSKSVERLASGLRINSAKDDAAGLAVRELIRADIATLRQGGRNARDAISMLQTAEGAMGSIDDILIRMKELAEQAATDSYSSDQRAIMNAEFDQLADEITRVATSTTFNGNALLNSTDTFQIHVGTTDTINITAQSMTRTSIAIDLGANGTRTQAVSNAAVADAGAGWFSVAASAFTVDVQFGTETKLNLSFDATRTYSMNEVATTINAASQTANSYNMASIAYDTDTGQYSLKLTALAEGTPTVVIDNDANAPANAPINATSDFTVTNGATGSAVTIVDTANAVLALVAIGDAISAKDTYRAKLGYMMNRLESAAGVLDIQAENLLAAESRISDVDVASEMANMTRTQVLAQAGIAMLGQANSMPQMALQLLRG